MVDERCDWAYLLLHSGKYMISLQPLRSLESTRNVSSFIKRGKEAAHFRRIGNHHMAVHPDIRVVLVYPFQNGRAHGDVWDEVATLSAL